MTIRVGSCFSGIEGFGLGLEQAGGFEVVWQIELDDDAVSVLERHYPNTLRVKDIREAHGRGLPAIDLLVGGWPCQDLSVAGARAGLAGERSGLFFELARLARECSAAWILWENVPGLLSSFSTDNPPPSDLEPGRDWESEETRDLGIVLDTLSELRYGWAFRTLDARYTGVAQRRRRIFFVGCLGDSGVRPAQVLFEPDSSPWDPAPSRTQRQGAAADPQAGAGVVGFKEPQSGARESDVVGVLDANYGSRRHNGVTAPVAAFGGNRTSGEIDVSTALSAHGGTHGRLDFESETFIVDATNGGQGAGDPGTLTTEQSRGNRGQMVASPITASAGHHGRSSARGDGSDNLIAHTLTIRSGATEDGTGRGTPRVACPEPLAFNWQTGGDFRPCISESETSARHSSQTPAIAIPISSDAAAGRSGEAVTPSADAEGKVRLRPPSSGIGEEGDASFTVNASAAPAVATFDPRNVTSQANRTRPESGLPANTLHQDGLSVITPMTVRRLTPTECARLQGFPDDWVRYRADGSMIPDGTQYRLLGNAVAVPVIAWIGRRLRAVMEAEQ